MSQTAGPGWCPALPGGESRQVSSARSGAALIIAMIILIALMLLGLPFLFSQSMGLSGTRTLQAAQTAHIYGITAQNFGSAIAVYGTQDHWLTNKTQPWTALQIYLSDFPLGPTSTPLLTSPLYTVSQIPVNPGAVGFNPTGAKALIGTSISDESGRISANTLGPKGWTEVLKAVNIMDWDDGDVVLPAGFYPNTQLDDYNSTGQLVDAIMALRLRIGPFTKLDDLLAADPRQLFSQKKPITEFRPRLSRAELARLGTILTFHNPAPGRGLIDLGNVVAECTDNSFTHYLLTDMPEGLLADESWLESESKKPGNQRAWAYVGSSVQNNAQGNSLMRNSLFTSNTNAQGIMHGGSNNAFGKVGEGLALAAPPLMNIHEIGAAERLVEPYKNWPVIPLVPAPAGIRTYPDLYALTLADSIYSNSGGELLKPFMGPDTARRERQPASLATSGVFRVQSASTVRDSAGNIAAQETRTSIVQAVPQEQALEVRWNSQDTLELLSRQRWTSAMESRPKPINRVIGQKPNLTQYSKPLLPLETSYGGLSPGTLPTLADGNAAAGSTRAAPVHLNITWRSTFGRDKAVAAGDERKDSRTVLPEISVTNQADNDALETEGMMLKDDKVVAISLDAPALAAPQSGPLTRVTYGPIIDQEMSSRHLSFWFKPTTEWKGNAVVPIMEVRMPASNTATLAVDAAGKCITTEAAGIDNPGANDQQNYVGLYFDPKPFQAGNNAAIKKMTLLALCISAPSAEHKVSPLYNMGDDITFIPGAGKSDLFAGVDERSLTGPLSLAPILGDPFSRRSNFSRLLKDNRVMHGIILPEKGLEKHRWYHVQIALGTGQPGSVAVVLDGLPGRDLTTVDDPSLIPKAGDRFTVPALLLATTVLAREALPSTDLEVRDTLFPIKVEVKVPSILGLAGLRVEELLPARGMIRVGDEYIRYGTMTPNSDWKMPATLNACARGQRQNTQTDSTIPAYNWPATQRHEVGALVVPGDFHVELGPTILITDPLRATSLRHLYSGASTLSDAFGNGDPKTSSPIGGGGAAILQWQTWATFKGGTSDLDLSNPKTTVQAGDNIILDTTYSGVPISDWPQRGIVRLLKSGIVSAIIYYHYDKIDVPNNKLMNLQPIADSSGNPSPNFNYHGLAPTTDFFVYASKIGSVPPLVWLVSMAVNGDQYAPVEGRPPFPYPDDASLSPLLKNKQNPMSSPGPCMAQLLATDGRCEWVSYQTIVLNEKTGNSYLVNSGGWGWAEESGTQKPTIARGQQRTVFLSTLTYRVEQFPPIYTTSPATVSGIPEVNPIAAKFLADTVVVPVQTENDVAGHWFEAGDVVTLTPKNRSETRGVPILPKLGVPLRPVQRIVRFVSHDGFGRANQSPANRKPYDTKDGYFAFSAGLPYPMISNDWLAVCGTGWNANRDWSSGSNYPQPPSCLPRLDGFTVPPDPDGVSGPPGALIFGGEDLRSNSPNTTSRPGSDLQIDALCAGTWPGVINIAGRSVSPGVIAFVSGTAIVYTMPNTGVLPMYAVGNGAIFTTGVDRRMGLVEIDGEVFAFQQLNPVAVPADASALAALRAASLALDADAGWNNGASRFQVVKLVGRALLGSAGRIHLITSETPTPTTVVVEPLYAPLPVQMLPIGPVYNIPDAGEIDSGWFSFVDGETDPNKKLIPKVLQAPALIVCNPDGSIASGGTNLESLFPAGPDRNQSIQNLSPSAPNPNFNKYHTAEWLRGLYNTTKRSWSTVPLPPLAIGWWPRYPSAMPESAVTLTAQHYRSRVYSWAGFPWHLHRMRFDPSNFITANADAAENDNLPLTIEAKVMAGAIDGDISADGAREGFFSYLDWSKLNTESVSTSSLWNSTSSIFSWLYAKKEADGIEVRLSWRYNPIPIPAINPADDLALPMNRAPVISTMTLHGYAPVTVLATEDSR